MTFGLLLVVAALRYAVDMNLADRPPDLDIPPLASRLMLGALACLWLFAAWVITYRLVAKEEYLRLVLFYMGSGGAVALSASLLQGWYRRRGWRGFFGHQLAALAVTVLAVRADGPAWILVLPSAAQAAFALPPRRMAVILAAQLVLSLYVLVHIPIGQAGSYVLNVFSSFFFTVGCSYTLRHERNTRQRLHEAHEQLRLQAEKAEELAAAEERNRLAREIHDGAAHHLTAANVLIEAGLVTLPKTSEPATRSAFQKAQGQVRRALQELRHAIAERPTTGAQPPLVDRMRRLLEDGEFPAQLQEVGTPRRLAIEAEHALYRVAQEALTNASKHAPGATISLTLDFSESWTTSLQVENREATRSASGDGAFGLLSLRARMDQLGGRFSAGSDKARGLFVVRAEVAG